MKLKAYPRVWVDLKMGDVFSSLFQLINYNKARGNTLLPEFEKAYAEFIGTKEAVGFTNCRSALYFSLKALNFNEGDEVILPAFTFWVDAAVVVLAGLKPVFVDVEPETMNIDATKIEAAITERTRAILLVHLNGLPANMDAIIRIAEKYKLRVIEDCARSCGARYHGKRVGSYDIGAFSFGYGKSFYGFGGGMITSNDVGFIKSLKAQKQDFKTISIKGLFMGVIKGCILKFLNNPFLHMFTLFQMVKRYQAGDERFASWFEIQKPYLGKVPEPYMTDMYNVQAKVGLRQIKTTDVANSKRMQHLKTLNLELAPVKQLHPLPFDPEDREHICVHYAIQTDQKKSFQEFLMKHKIDAQEESAQDVTQMQRFKEYADKKYFPNAAGLNQRVIYLPTHACLNKKDMIYISEKVKEFYAE